MTDANERKPEAQSALRAYPRAKKRNSQDDQVTIRAVEAAMEDQAGRYNGEARLRMIELVYFKKTHTMVGAADVCHYSKETIMKWNREILTAVRMALKYEKERTTE